MTMDEIMAFVQALSVRDSGLLTLSAIIIALFVVTVAFCGYTLLLRWRNGRRDDLWERLRARWEQPVLGAISDPDTIPDVRAEVDARYRRHFVRFVLEYSRRVRGSERETLRRLVAPFLDEIAPQIRSPRPEVRARAVQTLGTLGLPRYADVVLDGLKDESPLVAMAAARYLARQEYAQYAPAILDQLQRFSSWNRSFLASMLANMGPAVLPALRDALGDGTQESWLRVVFAEALRMGLDPRAADVAADVLSSEHDRDLRASLLRLLAAVGRPEHLAVVRRLTDDDDEIVRAQALHALGVLGGEEHLPLLFAGMDDPSPWAKLHAARGVRDVGGRKLLEAMAGSAAPDAALAGQVLFEEHHG